MDYELSEHAIESLHARAVIRRDWMERVLANPSRVDPDPVDRSSSTGSAESKNMKAGCYE